MSTPNHHPDQEAIETQRKKRRCLQEALREQQRHEGLIPHNKPSVTNACSPLATIEEECAERVEALAQQIQLFRQQLPVLLKRLRAIPDPRQPKKIRHTLTTVMIYGMLTFVLHYTSRRQANECITRPMIEQNLRRLFPELKSLPHADTLFRLLRQIDVGEIEKTQINLVHRLIRKKKFKRFLINNCYPVAVDGTQKLGGTELWSEGQLQHRIAVDEERTQFRYSVYVLEANLSFRNGMVIPLMTEFLDYRNGDSERDKQDCETRAFHRLSERIKKTFPRLPILLLLDGLYAQGPVMERCRKYNWPFMIVLKDRSLPTVWQEYHGLVDLQPDNEHRQNWGTRHQHFRWVNTIRYEFGANNRQAIELHVVVCTEQWQAVNDNNAIETKTARHAWISSRPLNAANVHERCNLAARYRWGIEGNFLVEKHQGYSYQHLFAKDWNAMRGYHYLMRLAHLLNTLARFSSVLKPMIERMGVRPFIEFLRITLSGPWLDTFGLDAFDRRMREPFQLRFV